jgi:23S rRNA (uracil1939-C5)-methyltransferase
MDIEIRKALPADAPEVADVFIASQADALPFLGPLHTPDETRTFIATEVFANCEVWLAAEQRRIVGMLALAGTHLDHLYLLPTEYRRGIGTLLLDKAKQLSPAKLTLYAFQVNARARAFYERHGFIATEFGDGSGNEAGEPDVLYEWRPPTVDILRIGHRGDGETADGLYVPFTVPGDKVTIETNGDRARVVAILDPGPTRAAPACKHFGVCGGCALQHVEAAAYREWKREQVVQALAQRGIVGVDVAPVVAIASATRRSAVLAARLTRSGVVLGFQERFRHFIVDVEECPVLHPRLAALLPKLRAGLEGELSTRGQAEIGLTLTDTGVDTVLGLPNIDLDQKRRTQLASLAAVLALTRLTVNGELLAQAHTPTLRWGDVAVALPPGAFVQAVAEAERAMQTLVVEILQGAKRIADLFSGCGAFTFPLARHAAVAAFDSDADAIAALAAAAQRAQGLKPVTAERRDLFRRPLLAAELDKFDAVVIDPPRAGAKAQTEQLAASKVRTIAVVSCNPATFARDARALIEGGYALKRVTPIDQFLWSPHVELVAHFARE